MTASDIHAESGSRAPLPRREDLDETGRDIYDHHIDPKGGSLAGLRGPGGIRLHSPTVSQHTRALNQYLRRHAGFPGPVRELAILVAAREMDSRFEWAAHEPEARKEGLSEAAIDAVKHRRPVDGLPETEALVITLGRQLFRDRKVASDVFARAQDTFGLRGIVDLVTLMGQYAATALILCAFDVQLRPGETALLPPD